MVDLMDKDLDPAIALAERTGVLLRTTPLVRALPAAERGLGRKDCSVLATLLPAAET